MRFVNIDFDPSKNPAVLDTGTWDAAAAWRRTAGLGDEYLTALAGAVRGGAEPPRAEGFVPAAGSIARRGGNAWFLCDLADRQSLFAELGRPRSILGAPVGARHLPDGQQITFYRTDAELIDRYVRRLFPEKGPRAMGSVPRLGIGNRHSATTWPGIFRSMDRCDYSANAIQNSLRELALLDEILAGGPPRTNHLFSFGTIQEAHTGSTFEGLWTEGVLAALRADTIPRYGADADHIQVKRGGEGIERAKKVIRASRYYSFYTLDVSDILDYEALGKPATASGEYLEQFLPDPQARRDVLSHHRLRRKVAGIEFRLSEEEIGLLVGKYWRALDALEELTGYLDGIKEGVPYDVELSIDETPAGVKTCDVITRESELIFLIAEAIRRGIRLTHIAPNFGVEKGTDYRCPDGLPALEARVSLFTRIAEEYGIMLDCHSGDDLLPETRRVIGRAARGRINFKVSPYLQVLFAETLHDIDPEKFRFWYEDSLAYAREEAEKGSPIALESLAELDREKDKRPSPKHAVFHHFNFPTVGKRDQEGNFLNRHRFYDLSDRFRQEYTDRLDRYLCEVAHDIFASRGI